VHYPKGIAPGSQTGTALSADFSSPPSVVCPCGVFHPTKDAAPYPLQPSPSRRTQRSLNCNGNRNRQFNATAKQLYAKRFR
jgi:hypothetical protein